MKHGRSGKKKKGGVPDGFKNERMLIVPEERLRAVEKAPVLRDLRVTHLGEFKAGENHLVVRRGGAREHVLIYCLSGGGSGEVGGKPFSVRAGGLVVLPPRVPHLYRADPQDPWTIFWFHFVGKRAADYVRAMGFEGGTRVREVPRIREMSEAFEATYRHALGGFTPAGLLGVTTEFVRMVGLFRRYACEGSSRRAALQDGVVRAIFEIQKEISRPWTLHAMAQVAGMSPSHFTKCFKLQTGEPPLAYLIHQRMQRAAVMLQRGERWIGGIARVVGYDDPYYFSRIFKATHGISPMEYRRRCHRAP